MSDASRSARPGSGPALRSRTRMARRSPRLASIHAAPAATSRSAARVGEHQPPVDRVVLGQHERGGVRPVFEHPALRPDHAVERHPVVGAEAAPQHDLVAPRHHGDRVELEAVEVPRHLHEAGGVARRTRAREALPRDDEAASGLGRDDASGRTRHQAITSRHPRGANDEAVSRSRTTASQRTRRSRPSWPRRTSLDLLRHRPAVALAHDTVVDLTDRRDLRRRARENASSAL